MLRKKKGREGGKQNIKIKKMNNAQIIARYFVNTKFRKGSITVGSISKLKILCLNQYNAE